MTTPWRLRLITLLSGAATMGLQMAAVRLFAPWFGGSSVVWATTISLSLLAMGTGYVIGGRRADSRPTAAPLLQTLAAAALLIALIPLVAPYLLPELPLGETGADARTVFGTALAYAALIFLPAALLGCTPTFIIRLAMRSPDSSGSTAGSLYGLSTFGSIIGTLVTALVLVQAIGTAWTFVVLAVLVALAAALALSIRPADTGATARARAEHPVSDEVLEPVIPMSFALLVLLIEGAATMTAEFGMARLVAPFFGASTIVWANIIAVTLGCIALGSWIGGKLVDRRPHGGTLTVLVLAASVTIAVLPFIASPVMRLATGGIDSVDVGTVVGSFLATIALLVVPVTLLGSLGPIVIRLAMRSVGTAGSLAGRSFAASTAGALVGTLSSALWLLPTIGTRRTLLAAALLLAIVPLLAPITRGVGWGRMRVAIIVTGVAAVGAFFIPVGTIKPIDGNRVRDEAETRYQFAQVVQSESDRRVLQLNEGWAVHSVWQRDNVLVGGIWDHFLVLPSLLGRETDRDTSFLIVGNAAGTAARAYDELRPDVEVEGVEIDGRVTELGRTWFDMPQSQRVYEADGRPFLRGATGRSWDAIHVDAYRQPYIPFYLATREFFELGRSRLTPGGIFSINVGSTPSDPAIVDAIAATMRAEFPLVVRYRAETYNELVIGVNDPDVTVEELSQRLRDAQLASQQQTAQLFSDFALGMRPQRRDASKVLTDDRAPVEWMTDRMIFREAE